MLLWSGEDVNLTHAQATFWVTVIGGVCLTVGALLARILTLWSHYRRDRSEQDELTASREHGRTIEGRKAAIVELRKLLQQERKERKEAQERFDRDKEEARQVVKENSQTIEELTREINQLTKRVAGLERGKESNPKSE